MKTKIRLFVFDFDGTALGGYFPYEAFPKPFADFLDGLGKKGIKWATNTTWSPDSQYGVMVRSCVKSKPVYLSGQTGRMLATVRRGRLVHDKAYEKGVIARERLFWKKHWKEINRIGVELLRKGLVEQLELNQFNQNIISFKSRKGQGDKVWKYFEGLLKSGEYYEWDPERGENGTLLPMMMNKGEVLAEMQHRLGIGPENTMVAGDGINDLHMFEKRRAHWMVCPANANWQIKQAVRANGGIVAKRKYSWGVVEGAMKLMALVNG